MHPLEQREKLARRVARHERLHEQARRRRKQVERLGDRRAKAIDGEALGRDAGTERVAMREEQLAFARESGACPVGGGREARIGIERLRKRARNLPARGGIGAADADQHHPRKRPVAKLVDEKALLGGGRRRKKRGEVGDEPRLCHLPDAEREPRDPKREGETARARHRADADEIVITE